MTNELIHFREVMDWLRESGEGDKLNRVKKKSSSGYAKAGVDNNNERSCLNCHRVIPKDRFSPFCSNACMDSWDKGGQERYRQMENAKKDPKILLQQYSQVMDYAREHSR